jgi:hypothetical protein
LTERDSHRFRSWCFLIQNVYRRSLSSSPDQSNPKVFMLKTRKDSAVHVSLSSSSLVKQPGAKTPLPLMGVCEDPFRRQMTTDWISAVDSLIIMRSFTGTKTCLGRGPRQRRAQWAGYRPARSSLSTVDVNKSSHQGSFFSVARKPRFLRTWRRT